MTNRQAGVQHRTRHYGRMISIAISSYLDRLVLVICAVRWLFYRGGTMMIMAGHGRRTRPDECLLLSSRFLARQTGGRGQAGRLLISSSRLGAE